MRPLRVLYIHMTGAFGGSSRSLLEAVRAFPEGAVQAMFLTPRGTAGSFFSEVGDVIEARGLTQFDNTRYSHYRGLRWLVLLREIAYLPTTVFALHRARRRWGGVDLIHLNEFTGLIPLWLARRWFRASAVIHVRSVARVEPASRRTRWVNRMLTQEARAVIAIDQTVRSSLPAELPVDVIHNAFSPTVAQTHDQAFDRKLGTLRLESFKVGFVGNLLRVKGIEELIEAARLTRDRGLDVEFLVVGDDARASKGWRARGLSLLGLRQNMRAEVEEMLDRHSLRDRVHLIGFTADIARAYCRMDVLAFPSHYDAPGRPIFEAAFFGVPSIVAVREPKADTLIDGVTGLAIEARSEEQLARAIERMAGNREETRRMGEAANRLAISQFDANRNAARMLSLYRRVIAAAA
jgi:glycosyltransferase involved in cell wall biosynthesis